MIKSLQLDDKQIDKLISCFNQDDFKEPIQYSKYRIEKKDCIITIYNSNKVVFQGEKAIEYINQLDLIKHQPFDQAGSDEVGTGDYFGPICVCASYVNQQIYDQIKDLNLIDSKQLTDEEILKIAPILIEKVPHSLLVLENEKFNQINKTNNLNEIKAKMHNQAYINLSKKVELPNLLVIDQFCQPDIYYHYLRNQQQIIPLSFTTKAENKYVSVAIGAIISRYAFLQVLDKMDKQYNTHFPKGAGKNVDEFLKEFYLKHPNDLNKVAKVSFKNTLKVLD